MSKISSDDKREKSKLYKKDAQIHNLKAALYITLAFLPTIVGTTSLVACQQYNDWIQGQSDEAKARIDNAIAVVQSDKGFIESLKKDREKLEQMYTEGLSDAAYSKAVDHLTSEDYVINYAASHMYKQKMQYEESKKQIDDNLLKAKLSKFGTACITILSVFSISSGRREWSESAKTGYRHLKLANQLRKKAKEEKDKQEDLEEQLQMQ